MLTEIPTQVVPTRTVHDMGRCKLAGIVRYRKDGHMTRSNAHIKGNLRP
jgi:hypothetical protein